LPTIVGNSFIPLFAASPGRLKSQVSYQNIVGTWGIWCILLDSVKKKKKESKKEGWIGVAFAGVGFCW